MTRSTPGRSQGQPGGNAARVRIMGTPRSGTNLAKHLVETHLVVPVVFDQGFWKHGIFPALMSGRDLGYGDLPILVMSKDPITQLCHGSVSAGTTAFSGRPDILDRS